MASYISASKRSHIKSWAEEDTWPEEYFQQDEQQDNMESSLARVKLGPLRRKRSELSLTDTTPPSGEISEEGKSAPYKNTAFILLL